MDVIDYLYPPGLVQFKLLLVCDIGTMFKMAQFFFVSDGSDFILVMKDQPLVME